MAGRPPKEKSFANMLNIAVRADAPDGNGTKLRAIAEKLVDLAMAGEAWAVQQVADRLDGKPAQEATVTIDDKRDATDWTRAELVAFLNERRNGSERAAEASGSDRGTDSVH